MTEYVVFKKGDSIRHCISIPEEFMDMELEIKIRPMAKAGNISQKIEALFRKYPKINPFKKTDPQKWQQETRNEWP